MFWRAARHEKVVFTPKKEQNRRLVQRHHHTPPRHRRKFGLWALKEQRVFGSYFGNHINRFINGAVSLSGKRFFTATNTLVTPETIGFLTDLLKGHSRIAVILDQASWNKSGKMKQFLAGNKERIDYRYFLVGWPQLNPMDGFWNALKRNSLMHEHYDSVDERVGRALYFL